MNTDNLEKTQEDARHLIMENAEAEVEQAPTGDLLTETRVEALPGDFSTDEPLLPETAGADVDAIKVTGLDTQTRVEALPGDFSTDEPLLPESAGADVDAIKVSGLDTQTRVEALPGDFSDATVADPTDRTDDDIYMDVPARSRTAGVGKTIFGVAVAAILIGGFFWWLTTDHQGETPDAYASKVETVDGAARPSAEKIAKVVSAAGGKVKAAGNAVASTLSMSDATAAKTPTAVSGSVDELAQRVIHGDFHNGAVRKAELGAQYAAVQQRVNELLGRG